MPRRKKSVTEVRNSESVDRGSDNPENQDTDLQNSVTEPTSKKSKQRVAEQIKSDTDLHRSVTKEISSPVDSDSGVDKSLFENLHSAITWSRQPPAPHARYQRASFGDARLLEEFVSLTVKVPGSWRDHWQVEARKRRTSLSALVIQMLVETLGLPEDNE